ncbi:sensor histidine kinase [Sporosarcina sp. HYO08]|uniref:sensor histidine kinase n=1 Tax=Sporosarcina sp. HYO08 TaxID=1759557 RepID=UPI00079B6D81|nr:sensor histidine kinase [Sporosarcina sp. HYO08]KXH83854.1 histidine kinase [Sporosarcina sp. HYO08]
MEINNFQITDLLMKMYDHSSEAIFFFDRECKLISMNNAATLILDQEVIERMVAGDPKAICLSCQGYTSEKEMRTCTSCYMVDVKNDFSSFQVYLDTRGQGIIPYTASHQMIDEKNGVRVLTLRNLTKQYKTQEMLNQQMMMKSIIKAQEDERKRISRELHDSVAQEMLSLLVDLRVLKYMSIEGEVLKKVQQTEISLMRLLDDIRHLSVELRPATLDDLGLEAAFRTHFKWIEKNYGLGVRFSAELASKRYEGEIETVVYRVCQEAVFNALKYAETDEITVRLFEENNCLLLTVVDEGIGFDRNAVSPKGTGLGLYGMKERAELVEGTLTILSEVGTGTKIQLKIPIGNNG